MIAGTGVDLVDTARIRRLLARHGERFLQRVFTPEERAFCLQTADPAPHLAARFAVKEALVKALGTGFSGGITFQDISTSREAGGRPRVKLQGEANNVAQTQGISAIQVSMSHEKDHAVAFIILEVKP